MRLFLPVLILATLAPVAAQRPNDTRWSLTFSPQFNGNLSGRYETLFAEAGFRDDCPANNDDCVQPGTFPDARTLEGWSFGVTYTFHPHFDAGVQVAQGVGVEGTGLSFPEGGAQRAVYLTAEQQFILLTPTLGVRYYRPRANAAGTSTLWLGGSLAAGPAFVFGRFEASNGDEARLRQVGVLAHLTLGGEVATKEVTFSVGVRVQGLRQAGLTLGPYLFDDGNTATPDPTFPAQSLSLDQVTYGPVLGLRF